MLHPQSLTFAFGLAKIQEEYILSTQGVNRGYQPYYTPVAVGASGSSMSFPKRDNQVVSKVSIVKTVIPIQKVS